MGVYGWVYRKESVMTPSDTFSMDEWIFSGVNALDNESNNTLANVPFPLKSFHYTFVKSGFTLSKSTLVVSPSSPDSFTIVLDVQPTSNVVLDITSENSTKIMLSPETVIFSKTTWNIAQTVTITSIDDKSIDTKQITISVDAINSDDAFDDLRDKSIVVTTRDNDIRPLLAVVEPIIEEIEEAKPIETPIKNIDINSPLATITKLYIATFARAPEARGSNYWLYKSKLNLKDMARSFFDQEETKQKYPQGFSDYDFIASIYNHVYNRDPDQAGGEYWLKELESGKIGRPLLILALITGAKGEDALMLEKQTKVGIDFAKSGSLDLDLAKKIIDDIRYK